MTLRAIWPRANISMSHLVGNRPNPEIKKTGYKSSFFERKKLGLQMSKNGPPAKKVCHFESQKWSFMTH